MAKAKTRSDSFPLNSIVAALSIAHQPDTVNVTISAEVAKAILVKLAPKAKRKDGELPPSRLWAIIGEPSLNGKLDRCAPVSPNARYGLGYRIAPDTDYRWTACPQCREPLGYEKLGSIARDFNGTKRALAHLDCCQSWAEAQRVAFREKYEATRALEDAA